jgi:hypothetical protein
MVVVDIERTETFGRRPTANTAASSLSRKQRIVVFEGHIESLSQELGARL